MIKLQRYPITMMPPFNEGNIKVLSSCEDQKGETSRDQWTDRTRQGRVGLITLKPLTASKLQKCSDKPEPRSQRHELVKIMTKAIPVGGETLRGRRNLRCIEVTQFLKFYAWSCQKSWSLKRKLLLPLLLQLLLLLLLRVVSSIRRK